MEFLGFLSAGIIRTRETQVLSSFIFQNCVNGEWWRILKNKFDSHQFLDIRLWIKTQEIQKKIAEGQSFVWITCVSSATNHSEKFIFFLFLPSSSSRGSNIYELLTRFHSSLQIINCCFSIFRGLIFIATISWVSNVCKNKFNSIYNYLKDFLLVF